MADFTVRVELHGATGDDYEKLHAAMTAANYRRYVPGTMANGSTGIWALPTAEYDCTGAVNATAYTIRDQAKAIADRIKPGAWCLVTEVANRAWSTQLIRTT
jgi:hypothetical protein